MSPWIAGAEIKGVVFIDSMVPDLQTLLGGVAPGERAFVLDMSGGGLEQIAAILAANNLTDVGSIAIVGHGASGSINVGTTTLNDADLAAHAAALKTIGAAVAPGGALDLYSCDTAAGPQGRAFVADLSKAAGVTVDASTKEIGKTASGENWTLNATTPAHFGLHAAAPPAVSTAQAQPASVSDADVPSVGPRQVSAAPTDTPFTTAATQSYQGTLAAATGVDGQLYGVAPFDEQNTPSFYLNSNGSALAAVAPTDDGADGVAVDTALGAIFELKLYSEPGEGVPANRLYIGSLSSGASAPVMSTAFETYYKTNFDASTQSDDTATGGEIAVDAADHLLFVPIGSDMQSQNGVLVMSYSASASGVVAVDNGSIKFIETSNPASPPSFFFSGAVYDDAKKDLYLDDASGTGTLYSENGLYRIGVSNTGAVGTTSGVTGTAPVAVVTTSQLSGRIEGLALDSENNRLFFATSMATDNTYTTFSDKFYVVTNPDTNPTLTSISFSSSNLILGVAYDDNSNTLYVTSNNNSNVANSVIDKLQLSGTGSSVTVTSTTTIPYGGLSSATPQSTPFGSLTYDPLSNLTVAGTTAAVSKTTPATLLASAPTITDYSSGGYLQSASVTITDATTGAVVAGDTLGLVKGGTFTAFSSTPGTYVDNGNTFNVSYANGVLTIANQAGSAASGLTSENTIASFQQVLGDVQYRNNSTDTNNRTATFQVNNGAIGNPSGSVNTQSFVVTVDKPPTVVVGGYKVPADVLSGASTTVAAAGAATAPTGGALAGDTSPANSGDLSITAVQTSGGTAGTVGSALSGTYGSLTLQSTGAYSYAAGNTTAIADAATGSHPVDSYSFAVSNAGGTTTETFAATIDRAPTGTADAATATELGPAVTGNVLTNDSDPDGDKLTVASVSFNGTAGTLGQSVTGTYGSLTLNADGSYSYTANNPVAYATDNPPRTDTFDYTDSDGLGGTSAPTALTFTVTCFATGTRIRVARGKGVEDAPVEALRVGDLAVTASGALRPIRWIGHRDVDCAAVPPPHDVRPVRIRAGAFGVGADGAAVPERDLRLSPGHPVLVGSGPSEVLVPIMCLINGTSVARTAVETVTYWHIELDAHDILLAEGLPAESYLDWGDRAFFGADAEAHALADPDFVAPGLAGRCRPVALDGRAVEAERRRLEAIFALQVDAMAHWPDPDAVVGLLV